MNFARAKQFLSIAKLKMWQFLCMDVIDVADSYTMGLNHLAVVWCS